MDNEEYQQTDEAPRWVGDQIKEGYGIAIDIGATTIQAVLINLELGFWTGGQGAVYSPNHLCDFGSDVKEQVRVANEGQESLMQQILCDDILQIVEKMLAQGKIKPELLFEIAITGNSLVYYLLNKRPCIELKTHLGKGDMPMCRGTAKQMLGADSYHAYVTIVAGISSLVGPDVVAGIYAHDLDYFEGTTAMLLGLGMNGEIAICNNNDILVASAAEVQGFRGGHILEVVPEIGGAIKNVSLHIDPNDESKKVTVKFSTFDYNASPIGLSLSGVFDIVSEIIRLGLVDKKGKLKEPLFSKGLTVYGQRIKFTQQDMNTVQIWKAATRTAIEIILEESEKWGMRWPYQACSVGGFSYRLPLDKAVRIGFFPPKLVKEIVPVDRSPVRGLIKFLDEDINKARYKFDLIRGHAKVINLAEHPRFNELYSKNMDFEV